MTDYTQNQACRICGNRDLYEFLDLGMQPPSNAFLSTPYLKNAIKEKFYPLRVYFCPKCGLVQLCDIVSPEILFRDYAYFTGDSSNTMKEHFKKLAYDIYKKYNLTEKDLIVDIGGNDGTFLRNFLNMGMTIKNILNIDPAENVAEQARLSGVGTFTKFFTAETAFEVMQMYGKAKVITATNVFAHVNNLYDFMAGVTCLLREDGVFIIEVPYLPNLMNQKEFDTVYFEHLSYFLIAPLFELFEKFGMKISKVEELDIHGGSIRCFVERGQTEYRYYIGESNFLKRDTYEKFGEDTNRIKDNLVELLLDLKDKGKRITGYGAPAKGNTLLNYCQIGPDILDYLSDTTPYKQGKLSPGMHIPVVSPDVFHANPPDYALILPWNYTTEILNKEQVYIKNGGKFIVPIPEVKVIGDF